MKDATDNCLPESPNYSALESSKKYTHTGSSNLEVLCSVRNVNSVKVGHGEIPVFSEGRKFEAAAIESLLSCLKPKLVVP